jgi:hypothetical protein
MMLTRKELLMNLAAVRDRSRIAWRLVVAEVAAETATFSYRLDRHNIQQGRSREGRYPCHPIPYPQSRHPGALAGCHPPHRDQIAIGRGIFASTRVPSLGAFGRRPRAFPAVAMGRRPKPFTQAEREARSSYSASDLAAGARRASSSG